MLISKKLNGSKKDKKWCKLTCNILRKFSTISRISILTSHFKKKTGKNAIAIIALPNSWQRTYEEITFILPISRFSLSSVQHVRVLVFELKRKWWLIWFIQKLTSRIREEIHWPSKTFLKTGFTKSEKHNYLVTLEQVKKSKAVTGLTEEQCFILSYIPEKGVSRSLIISKSPFWRSN